MGGEELEEIESYVFRTTRCGVIAGFHGCLSERVVKNDGSGLRELVATCENAGNEAVSRWWFCTRAGMGARE
jgi:hypothetical protein